jgi:hypothetical protein
MIPGGQLGQGTGHKEGFGKFVALGPQRRSRVTECFHKAPMGHRAWRELVGSDIQVKNQLRKPVVPLKTNTANGAVDAVLYE